MQFIKTVSSSVANEVADPIIKHVKYPFTAGGNTRALESTTADLWAQKMDMNTVIINAERENGAPTNQAQQWLTQVETIEKEAEEIQQKYRQLCRCLCNICPNVWSIYKISKMAANKLVEVKSLNDKKSTIDEVIIHMPPPLAQEMPASSSISPHLESALHYVKDDVHDIIGIWGMGGVGKTHLLKQINNKLSGDSEFEVVVFLKCPQVCTDEKIQDEIIDRLRLDKNSSMEQKSSTIYNFFKEKNFVIILDDLWRRVDLETIGIPNKESRVGTCKQKVVLATRSTVVCGLMEVKKKITVDLLKWDDAWSLFKEKVTTETISNPLIQEYAMDVVKELDGLPLALIAVGRAMYDKKDHGQWEQALEKLKKARFNDAQSLCKGQSVFHRLKFSYDNLRDEALKNCFLHCSLWPERFQILKDELVEFWMGLGLIKELEIQAAYNVGYSYIGNLKAACLLEVDDDEHFIKMHNVIRDMALWITKDKWIVQAGTDMGSARINVSNGTEKLSAMKIGATNLSFSTDCSSPKLSTLLLSRNHLNDSITLPIELLSLLTILDLSHNKLEMLPVGICELVQLQFLNLSYNPFKSLPEQLGDLTKLKYLLLRGLECVLPKGVLSKLEVLRVLDLSNSYSLIIEDNLKMKIFSILEEVKCLPFFQALGISIWDMDDNDEFCGKMSVPVRWLDIGGHRGSCLSFSSSFFGNSQFRNLSSIDVKETSQVQHVEFETTNQNRISCRIDRLEYLYFRKMWNMKKVIWKNLNPKDVCPGLQVLEFEKCSQLSSISWVLNLPYIQELRVIKCGCIEQLISIDELENDGITMSRYSVPLKKMHLVGNGGLQKISDLMVNFPKLEILEVYSCDKLRKLPFKTDDPPEELKKIRGPEKWWNNVEMEDGSHRSSLQPFFELW